MLGVNSAMVVPQDAAFSDFAVYPNSLNRHLRAMRGEKKRLDGNYPDDVLVDLSYYSPCLTRTVITNALDRICAEEGHLDDLSAHTFPSQAENLK